MNASPGAAVGKVVFDSDTAVEWAERGDDVILVRRETNPDDLRGMVAATRHPHQPRRQDLARRRGGARHGTHLRVRRRRAAHRRRSGGRSPRRTAPRSREGDPISIDGTTGEVFAGEVPVRRLAGRPLLRGRRRRARRRAGRRGRPAHGARRRGPPARGARQRRHPGRRGARAPVRGPGHRAVPHRAHVPRRAEGAGRAPDPGRVRATSRRRRSPSCCRCSATTSWGSSRRWTGCR